MPKILVRDPAWLVRSATAGLSLFTSQSDSTSQHRPSSNPISGPQRRIANRGTEVFVAVGNELRWSDLSRLKDAGTSSSVQAYRVLKTPVHREITQLSIAPSGDYLAILTSHTCHVCILPDSSHLRPRDTSAPLRLKAFQIGPTAHVLEQAPLASAIWHPLSPTGSCLITVTHDACIRLWELDSENRSSFDEPALALDLKKLGNATSMEADLSASKYGTNKGFSPDDVEMQVAAACFGGQGRDDEHGWASMTLWVAMTEGDVYALCPFLPSKWFAPASLLPTLSTSVTERSRAIGIDKEATETERRIVEEQCKWLGYIDAQDPLLATGRSEFETVEVYSRPDCVSAIPKLQGPFSISPEPDFGEITDIYVVGPKVDEEALFDEGNEDIEAEEGLSVSIICLATSTNEVHVTLDLDGVEAEWLPKKRSRTYTFDESSSEKELLLFETIDLANNDAEDHGWPTFTPSPLDRYMMFVTSPTGVNGLSFRPWVGLLEDELSAPTESGAGLRLDVVLESSNTFVDQSIATTIDAGDDLSAAVAILDPSIGYLVLTTTPNGPYASVLDVPSTADGNPYLPDVPGSLPALPAPEPRAPYRPAPAFDQPSALPQLMKMAQERNLLGSDLKRHVRFSPATLQIMTEAHRVMSAETHRLGIAAADLFRRCERMRSELQEQVRKVAEIAERVDNVTGQDELDKENNLSTEKSSGDNEPLVGKYKIEQRIHQSQHKTSLLNDRVDALRRRMLLLGGRELSAKEQAFASEVARLEQSVLQSPSSSSLITADSSSTTNPAADNDNHTSSYSSLATRFNAVQNLHNTLTEDVKTVADKSTNSPDNIDRKRPTSSSSSALAANTNSAAGGGGGSRAGGGNNIRRQKIAEVMALLERETALIDAVTERLRRLQS